ncbi:MAG TPA: HD domain-containing phosphohydrolase [Abditibacterium sp.]|jgi:putative two-component system response regulator
MQSEIFQQARFLLVDDEPANLSVLTQMLEEWKATHVVSTTNPRETRNLLASFQPDIVLLDWMMPGMNGFEVMQQLQPLISSDDFLPILILTADTSSQTKRQALDGGATDFLTKPFDAVELSLRLHNLLTRRFLHRHLKEQNLDLDQKVRERTQQLEQAEIDTVECLAMAGEYRDDDTGQHTHRVARTAALIARHWGLDEKSVNLIHRAAPLHDVGKIGIADSILLKPGKLLPEEFEIIKTHTVIGSTILARHHTPLLQLASKIALTHHERFDGTGYPHGLSGQNIPLEGRIVAVTDVFDALTHARPYKKAWPIEEALAEITSQSGRQFDPEIVDVFTQLHRDSLLQIPPIPNPAVLAA